ncbi:predicted protein [Histoplasma mississippiense (nom. inval.)]|uniref:predicted protein n=1 Tax=Ajellomyces capsulatus (strain NAm1 / WU24) TaxID=2059318 RepID=UPI000157C1C6|nr:predicted protein [Histoplasma mississippiense (nom. inval.)]EDN07365.1 predicted protein [Histoplasma mississippiense (nom. inval.)]
MSLRFIRFILTLLLLCKNPYAADCPLLGQAFPPPRMLSRSSTWKKAIEDFESNLKALLSQSTDLDAMTTSFSINIFSSHEKNLLYEYHHDAPGLKGSIAKGQKLNGDTMYRIASISKAMTLYTFLIETGFKYFNEPVAKFVPEIEREIQRQGVNLDDTLVPQWREITVGSLANMFAEFIVRHPVFAPFTTAIYSNVAFDIIGYALEQITNVPFEKSVKRSIINRLKLKRFGVETPPTTWGIIPSDPVTSYWNASVGSGNPAVGFYSSASDLARVGQSILQSRLISETDTRRWLKPNSHTSSLLSSVGSPWEIYRSSSPRLVDFYTKFGDLGRYGSAIALIPDYDVGFTVLAAGANPGRQRTLLADLISSLLITTLEKEARTQAREAFAGTYTSTYNENDMTTVVKISDEKDSPGPGLAIDSFYLNGVSFEDIVGAFIGERRGTFPKVGLRLQPTGLTARYANRSRGSVRSRTSFRVIAEIREPGANNNLTKENIFSGPCKTWMSIDGLRYGGRSIDELVFELDEAGKAVALETRITQQTLLRTDGGSP